MNPLTALTPDAAQTAAVRAMMAPASFAIIGNSDTSRWSANVFDKLRNCGYTGQVHLANPRGSIANEQRCATSCAAARESIDHGLIVVSSKAVADAVAGLAITGAYSVGIFAGGFSETGAQGQALQVKVRALAANKGVRLLRPTCLGSINFTNYAKAWTMPVKAVSRNSGVDIVPQSSATGCRSAARSMRSMRCSFGRTRLP